MPTRIDLCPQSLDELPERRAAIYDRERGSKIYIKPLSARSRLFDAEVPEKGRTHVGMHAVHAHRLHVRILMTDASA